MFSTPQNSPSRNARGLLIPQAPRIKRVRSLNNFDVLPISFNNNTPIINDKRYTLSPLLQIRRYPDVPQAQRKKRVMNSISNRLSISLPIINNNEPYTPLP